VSTYSYEATNFAAETINGEMEASSRDVVVEHLRRLGYIPLGVDRKVGGWLQHLKRLRFFQAKQLSLNDIVFLTQELTIMLRAGLPLEKALSVLVSVVDKPHVKQFLDGLLVRVRSGVGLAEALAAQEMGLPKGYIGMVRAGEMGGAHVLETTLERLTEHLKRVQKAQEAVFSAMLYPAIVLGMAALSITLILIFVLPQFEPLFQSAGDALPLSTKIVMAAGYGLRHYGFVYLFVLALIGLIVRSALQTEGVRMKQDTVLLRIPKIGSIIVKAEMAKFCNMLGVLLSNSVIPVTAISTAAESFGNRVFVLAMKRVVVKVKEGELLSAALSKEKVFPDLPLRMIKIGEETGQIDTMLLKTAEIYDREVQRSIEGLMTLLTPLMTIILGLIIAIIIAAILSAILSVNDMVT